MEKGESLKDTVLTLSGRTSPTRSSSARSTSGAAALVARWTSAAVVNAGDGKHEHPTQALLGISTHCSDKVGSIEGKKVWIVGDIRHSRVARSNIHAFRALGAEVTVCGPPPLVPDGIETLGCNVRYTLDDLGEADVVYALRMQNERMKASYVPSLREYVTNYQITARRLHPRQLLMHPGPVNRGVELSGEVVGLARALITDQVESGVVVRMAVLYELLAGANAPAADRAGDAIEAQPA